MILNKVTYTILDRRSSMVDMKFFEYAHLPKDLQEVSEEIYNIAKVMEAVLEDGPEKSAGMRKLLEAKDCFVRVKLQGGS